MARPYPASEHRRPAPLGAQTDHYWLVKRMAQSTGTDLVAASKAGHLTQAAWAGMVHRCRGCQWSQSCERWLDRHGVAPRDIPASCLNRQSFRDLQDRLSG